MEGEVDEGTRPCQLFTINFRLILSRNSFRKKRTEKGRVVELDRRKISFPPRFLPRFVASTLPASACVRAIVRKSARPREANGKINRRKSRHARDSTIRESNRCG